MRGLKKFENDRLKLIAAWNGYLVRSGRGNGKEGSTNDMLVDLMDGDAFLVSLADVPKTIRCDVAAVLERRADSLEPDEDQDTAAAEVAEELRKIAAAIRYTTELEPLQRGE